jgi:AdoMet-dependent heme synthase
VHTPVARSYDQRPLLIFWEMTKACPLACAHCRAHAQHVAMPGEMSTEEGTAFLEDCAGFGSPSPILVLTGGDPLARPDFFTLLERAHGLGLKLALAPAVSSSLAGRNLDRIKELGVNAISISLDGARAETHEGIRQVPGHFQQTIDKLGELVERGFMVQVNTTVMRRNAEELGDVAVLLKRLGVHVWEVFFLVHVGRGTSVEELTAIECEDVSHFLFDSARYGFIVRTVEGPFFRRVVTWRAEAGPDVDPVARFGLGPLYQRLSGRLHAELGAPTLNPKATSAGTRDGNGILFVAHDGGVCPAGFLPLPLGNVRERSVVDIYRQDPTLLAIRRADFKGRCGACDFREICGGSRSRAFAAFDDALAEDPACAHVPVGTTVKKPGVHLDVTG